MTIRLRITLWYMGLLILVLVILCSALYSYVRYTTGQDIKNTIDRTVQDIHITQSVDFWRSLQINLSPRIENKQVIIQVVDYITGQVRYTSNLADSGYNLAYPEPDSNLQAAYSKVDINGSPFKVLSVPITLKDNSLVGLLQVGVYTGKEEQILGNLRLILVLASVSVLLIAFLLGLYVSRQALKPLHRVTVASTRIEGGQDLGIRIPRGKAQDEIGTLTDTLNGMLSRLQQAYLDMNQSYDTQRRFVADASHELRTPLTTVRGNSDLLKKLWVKLSADRVEQHHIDLSLEAIQDISDESERMTRLITDLLALARGDAGQIVVKSPVELYPIVAEAARKAALLPRTAGWKNELDIFRTIVIEADRAYLQQLLLILIENAFKYTPSGEVRLSGVRRDHAVGIKVQDTGIGISEAELPHIFDRFYRADVSRGRTAGYGLGLSIAKWIIDEHHASVEVYSKENEGSTFIVWFPIADQSLTVRVEEDDRE
ncbi:signal transduction histidine kinase [Paenibacillus phyllosphaerae]|uniref:histidine kinase n=1 Tax=Paenibacillus phyllosphaerae TaxID=274593 RepID=A0A7W5AYH2_9BACL|nr:HAMP domain-containing sensor histidine kinase [Paenibacillus phyllosphaerae]MBB3111068.1 signal transduction histidine kinase [Paenibacillus phyllosphaerae]